MALAWPLMLDRRNLPLLVALCCSLLLHALTIGGARTLKSGPGLPAWATTHHHIRQNEPITISLADPDKEQPRPQKKPAPKPKPPKAVKPPQAKPKPPAIRFPEMGEHTGTGIGANQSPGAEPLRARDADADQAQLTRHPGGGGAGGQAAADLHAPSPEQGHGGQSGQPAVAIAPPLPAMPPPETPARQIPRDTDPAVPPSGEPADSDNPQQQPPAQRTERSSKKDQPPIRLALAAPSPPTPVSIKGVSQGPTAVESPPQGTDGGRTGLLKHERGAKSESQIQITPLPSDPNRSFYRPVTKPSDMERAGVLQFGSAANDEAAGIAQTDPSSARAGAAFDPYGPKPAFPRAALSLTMPPPSLPPPASARDSQEDQPTPKRATTPPDATHKVAPPAVGPLPQSPQIATIASGDGLSRGGSKAAGEVGHSSDSDSDAFSKLGDVHFLADGRLDVRFGRKVKTTRPHIPVVGLVDQAGLANPRVVLQVSIDSAGKVTQVTVSKSSGSTAIDTSCLKAMYDWWFEPLQDAKGKARPDTFLFGIEFR